METAILTKTNVMNILLGEYLEKLPSAKELSDK